MKNRDKERRGRYQSPDDEEIQYDEVRGSGRMGG